MHSIGKAAAVELLDDGWWKDKPANEIVDFQLFTAELCMPFDEFHRALTTVLQRPVFTHELGLNYDGIVAEYLGERPAPTLQQIIGLIPEHKRVVTAVGDGDRS